MPNGAKQRLAFEIGADIEEGARNVDTMGQKIAGLGNTVDNLTKVEKRATTARSKAIASANKYSKSTTALRRGIHETGGAVEELTTSMDKGNEATEKLAQGTTSTVSSLLTMGPAAAGITAATALLSAGVAVLIGYLEEVRVHKVWADVREGIHVWRGGLGELLKAYDELLIKIEENEKALTKWERRQKELADGTLTWKDVWLELAYGVGHVAYKVAELGEKSKKYQEDQITATEDYNRVLESVIEKGIANTKNIKDISSGLRVINDLKLYGLISTERELELVRELKEGYVALGGTIPDWGKILTAEQTALTRLQGVRSAGIDRWRELEKRLADDIRRITLDTYDYRLAKLQEDYAEHVKVVRNKKLLEDWYTVQLEAIYEERYNVEMAALEQSLKALEALIEGKQKIYDQMMGQVQRYYMDETEYAILQIEAQAEAYRQLGMEEIDVALWTATKIAAIQEKVAQEQLARYRETAGQIYDIMASTFQATEEARQRTQELGLKGTYAGLELERLARLASLAEMIKAELAAQAKKHAIIAAALMFAGLWTEGIKHGLAAAAFGVSAAITGTVARGAREAYEEGIAREEERLAAEREAAEPRAPPGAPSPGGYPGGGARGRGAGATIREAGVVNVRNDIVLTVYGAVGIERFKEMVLDIVSGAFNQGRLP